MTQAAILIQSKFRSYYEQKKFQQSRRAAMLIQQYYRSYKECGKRRQNRRTATIVQQKLRWAARLSETTRIRVCHCLDQSCAVMDIGGGISTMFCRIIILAFSASPPFFVCASKLGFFCVCVCLEAVCLPRSRTKLLARLCGFYDAAATGMTSPSGQCPSAEQCDVFMCVSSECSVKGSRIDSIQIFYGITQHSCFQDELAERKSLT